MDDLQTLTEMLFLTKKMRQIKNYAISFLSGGIDSAVSTAIMQKEFNYEIIPVYVNNFDGSGQVKHRWSHLKELQNLNISMLKSNIQNIQDKYVPEYRNRMRSDIDKISQILKILDISQELIILDCRQDYYDQVVLAMLESYLQGKSINIDVLCDEVISVRGI